jgi:hypothetical protein
MMTHTYYILRLRYSLQNYTFIPQVMQVLPTAFVQSLPIAVFIIEMVEVEGSGYRGTGYDYIIRGCNKFSLSILHYAQEDLIDKSISETIENFDIIPFVFYPSTETGLCEFNNPSVIDGFRHLHDFKTAEHCIVHWICKVHSNTVQK